MQNGPVIDFVRKAKTWLKISLRGVPHSGVAGTGEAPYTCEALTGAYDVGDRGRHHRGIAADGRIGLGKIEQDHHRERELVVSEEEDFSSVKRSSNRGKFLASRSPPAALVSLCLAQQKGKHSSKLLGLPQLRSLTLHRGCRW